MLNNKNSEFLNNLLDSLKNSLSDYPLRSSKSMTKAKVGHGPTRTGAGQMQNLSHAEARRPQRKTGLTPSFMVFLAPRSLCLK